MDMSCDCLCFVRYMFVYRFFFFFFSSRRRHTRLQGDWSSDVCSSDLSCSRGDRGSGERAALNQPCRLACVTSSTALRRPSRVHILLRCLRTVRSEEHTSELQSPCNLVCRLLLEKKNHNYCQYISSLNL